MTKIFTKYEPIPNTRVNDKNYHKNPPKPKSPDPRPQATFLITHPGGGGGGGGGPCTAVLYKGRPKKNFSHQFLHTKNRKKKIFFFDSPESVRAVMGSICAQK